MNRLVLIGIVSLVLPGCVRSSAYKNEQEYYRSDSSYGENYRNTPNKKEGRLGQPKKKIFVLPFLNDTPIGGEDLGYHAASELLRDLQLSRKIAVPSDIRVVTTSKDYYSGTKVRLSSLVKEGKRLGVGLMAVGKIRKVIFKKKGEEVGLFKSRKTVAIVDMELRLYDVSQAKEILYDEKLAEMETSNVDLFNTQSKESPESIQSQKLELIDAAVRAKMREFGVNILRAVDKVSWEGRIAKISHTRIYINAGRSSGLNIGDILKVLTKGDDVFDPVTGSYIGSHAGQPKGTLEIVDFLGPDASIAKVHSGGGFVENDAVQLY